MTYTPSRIFSLDPMTKGFGYAILELPLRLIEWGMAWVKGDKERGAIARFEALLDRFRPDALVCEDTEAPGSRRSPRVRRLLEALKRIARARGIAVYTVARRAVLKCFFPEGHGTKHGVASALVERFPELGAAPKKRKIYQTERERMSIYDALAFGVAHASE
jgi:hypothetical protein